MNNAIEKQTEEYSAKRHQRKRWQKVVTALAAVAVFCTTYALILPAITWTRTLVCELPEHTHDESCYELVTVPAGPQLTCTETEHTHDDACYERGALICTLPESEGHAHGEGCYDEAGTLVCELTESAGHTHGNGCYERGALVCTAAEHVHGDECYTEMPEHEEKVLKCGLAEHTHTDACYDAPPASDPGTYCGQIAHKHSAEQGCYYADGTLKCTIPEHEHALLCQSDTSKVETRDQWVASFASVTMTGDWAKDVIAIAKTQIGYRESEVNFTVAEDGVTKLGYTRYGAWYGRPYDEWCAMFASFCLRSAGVDESLVPSCRSCRAWTGELEKNGLYHAVDSGYVPKSGDLVFFDTTRSGRGANHVGLVSVGGSGTITTVEGNIGAAVCTMQRSVSDGIIGYGELPTNPIYINKEDESKTIESAPAEDGAIVTVTGILPEGVWVELKTAELTEDDITAAFGEDAKLIDPAAYDINLYKDGALWQPEKTVSVSLRKTGVGAGKILSVVNAEGKAETVSARSGEDSLSFETARIGRVIVSTQPPKMMMKLGGLRSAPYTAGTIVVAPPDDEDKAPVSWPEAGTDLFEYDLQNDTTGMFNMIYTPHVGESGTERTVLVVTWPEYGTKKTSAPSAGANHITSISFPDSHTAIIALEDYTTEQCTFGFTIAADNLTNAQAAYWMDGGDMSTCYSATEYQLNEGFTLTGSTTLAQLQANATPYATFTQNAIPKVYTGSLVPAIEPTQNFYNTEFNHTYHVGASAVPQVTDFYLSNSGVAASYSYVETREKGWANSSLRWNIPTAHISENPLIEVTSIRIYVPDERLMLSQLGLNSNVASANNQHDLIASNFNEIWNAWQIGPRSEDENGFYYYDITPPAGARWFNTGVSGNLNSCYYGMRLIFQLVSTDEPLAPDTIYSAPDTVVSYKLAGSTETFTYTQDGPQIRTWMRESVSPSTSWNGIWYKLNKTISNNNVVIGSAHINESFTVYNNNYYRLPAGGYTSSPSTEYIPEHTGPLTMHYEFPYNIQPSKLTLNTGCGWARLISGANYHREAELTSIVYTTADGVTHSVPETDIAEFNTFMLTAGNSSTRSFTLSGASETNRVVSLDINWNKLYKDYDTGGWRRPAYNSLSAGNMASNWSNNDDYLYLLRTGFDYVVAPDWEDDAHTIPVTQYDMVQVKYDLIYDGESHTNDNYLWFRLKNELCPSLKGTKGTYSLEGEYLDGREDDIGSVSLYVGTYGEYKDDLVNPVIDLKMWLKSSEYPNSGSNNTNMPNADALAFFTGKFTAYPKLSGWVCEYDTNLATEKTWTIPDMTEATEIQIPLAEGEYFKTLSLHYNGTVSFPHDGPDDTRDLSYTLMSNIMLQRLATDPFTGTPIQPNSAYASFYATLYGYLRFENCSCDTHLHSEGIGQLMNSSDSTTIPKNTYYPEQHLFRNRTRQFSYSGILGTITDKNTTQGGGISFSYIPKIDFNDKRDNCFGYNYILQPHRYNWTTSEPTSVCFYNLFPFDIDYVAYVELTDDDFTVDLDNTMFMGVSVSSGQVTAEQITVNGRRFLKLQFAEGCYQQYGTATNGNRNRNYGNFKSYPGCMYIVDTRGGYITDTMQIGLTALPSARIGEHYPIGRVYYDYSELLEQYDAPNITGNVFPDDPYSYENDYNMTNYTFSGAVPDEYGLASSVTTETDKLFMTDFGPGSATAQKVIVTIAAVTGADGFPGKGGIYDVSGRVTNFTEPETEDLSGLVTIKGSSTNEITDYVTCVKLPRQGKSVAYVDSSGNSAVATSDITIELRGPITRAEKSGIEDEDFLIVYTTDEDPTASSAYVAAASIEDWSAVTGFKVIMNKVDPEGAATLYLNLRTDKKDDLTVLHGYMGGSYTYQLQGSSGEGLMGLSTYNYNNILVTDGSKGIVFWDTYDENGTKATSGSGNDVKCETGIGDVSVSLYDADDELIMSTTTSTANATLGQFVLETYKSDAGQYIVIDEPVVDGVTVKLTKNSTAVFYKNQYDSDFDRNAEGTRHTLVLPKLPATGYNNISAGFVKLPTLAAEDITLMQGERKDLGAVLTYYLGMALPSTSYNISFDDAADETIADVTATTKVLSNSTTQNTDNARIVSDSTTVTGVAPGTTTVRIWTVTAAGDTVEKIVNIRVMEPTLTVTKEVTGLTGCTAEFSFTAELVGGSFETPAAGADYTVDENGVAHFSLADGESAELNVGDHDVIITETGHDGFHVKFSEGSWVATGYSQTVEDAAGRSITVTNTATAALPITGGIGAESLYALGILLILGSLACLVIQAKRKEE